MASAHAGPRDHVPQPRSAATSSVAPAAATRTRVRQVGAVILLLAAVAVWFGMAPEAPDPATTISVIERAHRESNANTSGAPEQAVVNGWTTIDYLQLLAQQSDAASARQDRSTAMLGLCVAGIALLALTVSNASVERLGAKAYAESAGATDPPRLSPSPRS